MKVCFATNRCDPTCSIKNLLPLTKAQYAQEWTFTFQAKKIQAHTQTATDTIYKPKFQFTVGIVCECYSLGCHYIETTCCCVSHPQNSVHDERSVRCEWWQKKESIHFQQSKISEHFFSFCGRLSGWAAHSFNYEKTVHGICMSIAMFVIN